MDHRIGSVTVKIAEELPQAKLPGAAPAGGAPSVHGSTATGSAPPLEQPVPLLALLSTAADGGRACEDADRVICDMLRNWAVVPDAQVTLTSALTC